MKRKFLGIFDRRPLIWFHYVPLVGIVTLTYFESVWLNLMTIVNSHPLLGWPAILLLYYVNLSIGDQLVHFVLGVD